MPPTEDIGDLQAQLEAALLEAHDPHNSHAWQKITTLRNHIAALSLQATLPAGEVQIDDEDADLLIPAVESDLYIEDDGLWHCLFCGGSVPDRLNHQCPVLAAS